MNLTTYNLKPTVMPKNLEYSLYIIKGDINDYKIQFVSLEDDDYPDYMDNFKFFDDCFQNSEQLISDFLRDSKGKEIVSIFEEEIKKIRAEGKSFYIEVRLKETNEVIICFDDSIIRRGKTSGPILSISTSFFNKTFIDKFWRESFKPLLQFERYYSRFNSAPNVYPNCKHNIT